MFYPIEVLGISFVVSISSFILGILFRGGIKTPKDDKMIAVEARKLCDKYISNHKEYMINE